MMRAKIKIKDDDTYVSQRPDNNTSWSALELPLVLITIHRQSLIRSRLRFQL